jgi:hypothetical protein
MDNTTILYNAIQRIYRNAIVEHIRKSLLNAFNNQSPKYLADLFSKKDQETGRTYWESVKLAANERRSGGTGELSTLIEDDFDLLGVEHFSTVFEKFFDCLCPNQLSKEKRDKNNARQTLLTWMKHVKNVRDPVSHPVSEDISHEDASQVLYSARKALDFCGLAIAASQILRMQGQLIGAYSSGDAVIYSKFPPDDEVVLDFIGRHKELSLLNEWILTGKSKRWALSGEGGRGKSAIAYNFGKSVSRRTDHGFEAVFWMSAKKRRFIEGSTMSIDRPDFSDKNTAISLILAFFGVDAKLEEDPESKVIEVLEEFPTLLIVDDIDTVQGEGEDAIEFLVMSIPERTSSRVLLTSRRLLFGLSSVTTQIEGLSNADLREFLKSRCDLMGILPDDVLGASESILIATDGSPLYIEDLLRLHQTGFSIQKAIGLWQSKRGNEARKYAIQREYDHLNDDAKSVLLALSLQGPCSTDIICKGLDWSDDRLTDALVQLRKMFLMASHRNSIGNGILALNKNISLLVTEVFRDTEASRRVDRQMKAAAGVLKTRRAEDEKVQSTLRQVRFLTNQYRFKDAEELLSELLEKFPARADITASLAWTQKKNKDYASARMNFSRAHDLSVADIDTYWHWSEMESSLEEWQASQDIAELGIKRFGPNQGLLFRKGYALHRRGRELVQDGVPSGLELCGRARKILQQAIDMTDEEHRNTTLRSQIYRAAILNEEVLNTGEHMGDLFVSWRTSCKGDPYVDTEYERLRVRFSEHLRPLD